MTAKFQIPSNYSCRKNDLINQIEYTLLKRRRWRYLRYIHLRDYVSRIATEIETVCVCGAGHGLAEVAIALEFPHLNFTLTDIVAPGYPNYHGAMDFCWKNNINNVNFSIWSVLESTQRRYDLVCSTEMLEHIENAHLAATNMKAAAEKFIYCLVPFGSDAMNANTTERARVWRQNEHYVVGFDKTSLVDLFGEAEYISGVYWEDAGVVLRNELQTIGRNLKNKMDYLRQLALTDVREGQLPEGSGGIKILAKAGTPSAVRPRLPQPLDEVVPNYREI